MKTRPSRISDLRWVRPVRQERSERTLQRLLDAAEEVIEERGFADASVADIAARARCSVGTFYRRFHDKHALLHALDERLGEEFRATMERAVDPARWEGACIGEIIEAYLLFALEVGPPRAALRRAAVLMAMRDPTFAERQMRLDRELHERLRSLLQARRAEIGHPDPDIAIDVVLEQLRAMLLVRLEGEPIACNLLPVSDDCFVHESLLSATRYLEISPAPRGQAPRPGDASLRDLGRQTRTQGCF
jgi:AcrR family transcriptional regulator